MTDFLTDYGVVFALVCAGAAVLYGALITQRLLRLSPGNDRMQEISGAVQEGAKAYLNRQYMIIAVVAIPLAILIALVQDVSTGIGFVIGGVLSGAAGFIGMNLSVRANARVAEAARGGVPAALDVAFKGGSVTGLAAAALVATNPVVQVQAAPAAPTPSKVSVEFQSHEPPASITAPPARMVAAAVGAVYGALSASFNGFVGPGMVEWRLSAQGLLAVVVGGAGSLWGPFVAGAGLHVLETYVAGATQRWPMVLGVLYVVAVVLLPGGLASLPGLLRRRRSVPTGGPRPAEGEP